MNKDQTAEARTAVAVCVQSWHCMQMAVPPPCSDDCACWESAQDIIDTFNRAVSGQSMDNDPTKTTDIMSDDPAKTTNPEPVVLSNHDLLWLAVHENGGDVVIPAGELMLLPKDRSVSCSFSADRTLLVLTASGASGDV